MMKQNKRLFLGLAICTVIIAAIFSVIVYHVFGDRAAYFFAVVFAIPLGAVSSLLLLMLYNSMK